MNIMELEDDGIKYTITHHEANGDQAKTIPFWEDFERYLRPRRGAWDRSSRFCSPICPICCNKEDKVETSNMNEAEFRQHYQDCRTTHLSLRMRRRLRSTPVALTPMARLLAEIEREIKRSRNAQ